jgi:hypothetical protein
MPMNETSAERGRFLIYHVWLVVNREALHRNPAELAPVIDRLPDGTLYLPVFSDSDLAQRFIDRAGVGQEAIPFEVTQADFVDVFDFFLKAGYENVAIDPEPNQGLRIAKLFEILRDFRGAG